MEYIFHIKITMINYNDTVPEFKAILIFQSHNSSQFISSPASQFVNMERCNSVKEPVKSHNIIGTRLSTQ